MGSYRLTAFNSAGKKLLDESFSAVNDVEAKKVGSMRIEDEGLSDNTYRCVSPDAKLILFHR